MTSTSPGEPGLGTRLRSLRRENGTAWTTLFMIERGARRFGASRVSRSAWRRRVERERRYGLTGTNTRERNRAAWNQHDWSQGGEEWSGSSEWRQALIDEVMLAHLPNEAVALEIGPGAGKWSVYLRKSTRKLLLVDVSERPLEICRERFGPDGAVSFHLTDGASLPGIPDSSVDFVWSFEAFVHIAPADQRTYLAELARVMRPGARAVIHHSGDGAVRQGVDPAAWRSSMTADRFKEFVRSSGMQVIEQRDSWGPSGEYTLTAPGDVITIFEQKS